MTLRGQVLRLYRRIMHVARTWEAQEKQQTDAERLYIREEARTLFRRNKNISSEEEIKLFLHEGEARLEIGLHYKNPYPRPVNYPQHVVPLTARKMKGGQRVVKASKPVYIKSYEKDS